MERAALALLVVGTACGPSPYNYGECKAIPDSVWGRYIASHVDSPTCPQPVASRGQIILVSGYVTASDAHAVSGGTNTVNVVFATSGGEVTGHGGGAWQGSYQFPGTAQANLSGSYAAGKYGGDYDYANLITELFQLPYYPYYDWAGAELVVKNTYAVQASISSPGTADPYSSVAVTVNAWNYLSPISYAWTVNGSPACGNTAACSAQVGDYGSTTNFAVTITDAEGDTGNAAAGVYVPYPACPTCMATQLDTTGSGAHQGKGSPRHKPSGTRKY